MSEPSFTGRTRKRTTSRRVVFADKASRFLITTGGIGTIIAVVAICVFLVYVVFPLFRPGQISPARSEPLAAGRTPAILASAIDEYDLMSWELFDDGTLRVHRLDPWEEVREFHPFEGGTLPVASAFEIGRGQAVFGFEDGSVRLGTIAFHATYLPEKPEPEALRDLEVGQTRIYEGGIVERTPEDQLRLQRLEVALDEPMEREAKAPVHALDVSVIERGDQKEPQIVVLDTEGRLTVYRTRKKKNLLTGKVRVTLTPSRLPYEHPAGETLPQRVFISALGDVVYLIWDDGRLLRYTKSPQTGKWALAEKRDLVPAEGATITVSGFLIGKGSLVVGDTTGRVAVWFRARPEEGVASGTADGFRFTAAHVLAEEGGPPATALAASSRSRLLIVGFANGDLRTVFVTNEHDVVTAHAGTGPITRLALSPRETVILATTPEGFRIWQLDAGYPDVTLSSLFLPQWYEGHGGPEQSWQSTGLTNEFEPKLGLMPLIMGTLKATFYSLLFGVPIALLAAIFTSEFLSTRVKVPIKSTIEVMASLPSVVLGFLAALVIAPFVQDVVPTVVLSFLTIPAMFLLGAYLWQLLPHSLTLRLGLGVRFVVMGAFLVIGVLLASAVGPTLERTFFWVADHQTSVSFVARADGGDEAGTGNAAPDVVLDENLAKLDDEELTTAIRLKAGFEIPAALSEDEPKRAAALEKLRAEPLTFHDGSWRTTYEPGRDFELLQVREVPAEDGVVEPVSLASLGAPLLVRRLPGSRLDLVVDGDTEAQRAAKALYLGLGRKPDIEAWLADPARGPATGGWFLLTLPLMGLLAIFVMGQFVRPWLRSRTSHLGRTQVAALDLVRFLAGGVLMLGTAWGLAVVLTAMGLDTRGALFGTYVQRNALVVGFVMGFAIIPIIYTLAEDALSSVPSHLREGSLGAGATPWQTAMRIIVPTAMSGLFSAVMIGLGRAVGETMIVLMAAGNTPIMQWNPFNGFRTLAANIAVELPEAVRGSSHYRTLFLCALALFAMTFVINTFAEAVRQRFRKRAYQL